MNKLLIFIFCYCPLFLLAQTNDAINTTNAHKSGIASTSLVNNVIFSLHLSYNKQFIGSKKLKEFEKCSFNAAGIKPNSKHSPQFSVTKNKLSVKPMSGFSKQISEINKRMKNIFRSNKSSGTFSNISGLGLIVGELSTVVEDGSVMPSDPKISKFINSFPPNSLMGYLLGSVFTPSGFYIGLSVPMPNTKNGTNPKKRN